MSKGLSKGALNIVRNQVSQDVVTFGDTPRRPSMIAKDNERELKLMEEEVMSELRQNEFLNDDLRSKAIDKNFNQMMATLNHKVEFISTTAKTRLAFCGGTYKNEIIYII